MNQRISSERLFVLELEAGLLEEGFSSDSQGDIALWSFALTDSTMYDVRAAHDGQLGIAHLSCLDVRIRRSYGSMIVVAEEQRSGRGREERRWHSAARAGLFVNYLLKLNLPLHELAGASLTAGVALHRAVVRLGARNVSLKWPNDLLCREGELYRKLGGILCETVQLPQDSYAVSVGIGLNLFPAQYPREVPAVSLAEASVHAVGIGRAFGVLTREIFTAFDTFATVGFGALRESWLAVSTARPGALLSVKLDASRQISGWFRALGECGELLLEGQDGQELMLSAGELEGFI